MRFLPILALLCLFSSCSWLLEEPLPRTNPADENAAVFYFRAIPQHNGGALDRVRLKWNWSNADPHNPGRVTILRKNTGYPRSKSDVDAVQVYTSATDAVEYFDVVGGPQPAGTIFYYTLYCDIDGFGAPLDLNSPPTEFSLQSINLPASLEAAFGFDGTDYPIYGFIRIADITAPFEQAVGAYAPDIGLLPQGFNIDIYDTNLSYSNSGSLGFYIQRITRPFPDDAAASVYYNLLQDPASYTSSGQVVESAATGNIVSSPELEALLEYWFDTLELYGFRIAPSASGSNDLSNFNLTVDYVGPPPP